MATYCYRCKDCGATLTGTDRALNDGAVHCETPIVRDYRAEGVQLGAGTRPSREMSLEERARLFLPTTDDFKGPDDPDGTKGLRAWRDEHEPTTVDPIGNSLPKSIL